MKIGIIGAGQLGRMLALAGYPLGMRFVFLDKSREAPGGQVGEIIEGNFDDPAALRSGITSRTHATVFNASLPDSSSIPID